MKFWCISPALLLLASLLVLAGCGGGTSELQAFEESQANRVVSVPVTTVVARDFERTVTGTGSLRAEKKTRIAPSLSGRIVALPVDIGDVVRKGDMLAQLRPIEFLHEVAGKEADLETAKARLADLMAWKRKEEVSALAASVDEARAAVERSRNDYKRKGELLGVGGIARSDFDRAAEEFHRAEASLEAAQARLKEATAGPTRQAIAIAQSEVKSAEADLAQARRELADSTIVAPYDAVVTGKFAEVGQEVNSMMTNDLLEISDISTLQAYFLITETLIPYLRVGTRGHIEVPSTGQIVPATVVAVNPAAEEMVRSFMIKAEVDNRGGMLRAGMFIRGTLGLDRQSGVPAVPAEALRYLISDGAGAAVENHNRAMLFVLGDDDTVHPTEVSMGLSDAAGFVQVLGGVTVGQRIVADGALPLMEGQRVASASPETLPPTPLAKGGKEGAGQ